MRKLIVLILVLLSFKATAQIDTIYTHNEKIACQVKEILANEVKFSYPKEALTNTLYKTQIEKIVFSSGRTQNFNSFHNYREINDVEDFNNITVTYLESEVKGLYNLGDITAKSQAATVFSNMETVKEKAMEKVKIKAAMLGANVILITNGKTTGFSLGNSGHTKSIEALAYTNKLPNYNSFKKLVDNNSTFKALQLVEYGGKGTEYNIKNVSKSVSIKQITSENNRIVLIADVQKIKESRFSVIRFNNNSFTIAWEERDKVYNLIVNM